MTCTWNWKSFFFQWTYRNVYLVHFLFCFDAVPLFSSPSKIKYTLKSFISFLLLCKLWLLTCDTSDPQLTHWTTVSVSLTHLSPKNACILYTHRTNLVEIIGIFGTHLLFFLHHRNGSGPFFGCFFELRLWSRHIFKLIYWFVTLKCKWTQWLWPDGILFCRHFALRGFFFLMQQFFLKSNQIFVSFNWSLSIKMGLNVMLIVCLHRYPESHLRLWIWSLILLKLEMLLIFSDSKECKRGWESAYTFDQALLLKT